MLAHEFIAASSRTAATVSASRLSWVFRLSIRNRGFLFSVRKGKNKLCLDLIPEVQYCSWTHIGSSTRLRAARQSTAAGCKSDGNPVGNPQCVKWLCPASRGYSLYRALSPSTTSCVMSILSATCSVPALLRTMSYLPFISLLI